MRTIKAFAVAALLATSAGAAMASPFEVDSSIQALDEARFATVLTVNPSEARSLAIDVDTASLQQKIKNNPALARTVTDQGFQIDQIVGLDATSSTSVTLYAL
ncbi:hypothetical protein DevBK_14225 [Devosia sp. BK]|uniref:hypothetical protein n=1 Tax=unclassified Devosia TaxID=196773 RepID=UPI0007142D97|nr:MULTISPECIES: hypothetical protein [unclassified Devosia]KQT48421.1 hypothetical protein ASG47_08725 [Devosia sp. Leaf420]MDV3252492.1 hypothetical protein [Devosia sp. BK]